MVLPTPTVKILRGEELNVLPERFLVFVFMQGHKRGYSVYLKRAVKQVESLG